MADSLDCQATVLITTKDRRDELRTALQSVVAQTVPVEMLVIDDGSTDGTADMVRSEFPGARLIRHHESRGLIVRRNEGARLAAAPVVVSIDDDAAFSTPHVVQQTLQDFGPDRVGAVAIPHIDVNRDSRVGRRAPDADQVYVTDRYIGTAHAVRRDVFLHLGGYREALVHQGEEGDFCLRMLAAGYVVRLGTADPIHHFESPKRDFRRMDYYGVRNAVLFAWQNVPIPFLLAHLPVVVSRCLVHTLEPRRLKTRVAGLIDAIRQCASVERAPVSRQAYQLARTLARGPVRLSQLQLPAISRDVTG